MRDQLGPERWNEPRKIRTALAKVEEGAVEEPMGRVSSPIVRVVGLIGVSRCRRSRACGGVTVTAAVQGHADANLAHSTREDLQHARRSLWYSNVSHTKSRNVSRIVAASTLGAERSDIVCPRHEPIKPRGCSWRYDVRCMETNGSVDARGSAAVDEDMRAVVTYLVAPESRQYIAVMDVLESSVTDLTPGEVGSRLQALGLALDQMVVETRLDKLREWGAVSARTDASRILRHADLLARNWRYSATPAGRQVQRFYRKVLAGTPQLREIPLSSLARVVESAEALARDQLADVSVVELIGRVFVNHDDIDAALVGAEDSLSALADRFDLTDDSTAELKSVLVGYATRVAAELERGSERAFRALKKLQPRFGELAREAVRSSEAQFLIERGALAASHGGRVEDWEGLLAWFDATSGRSARFALRLVRALPGMHVNLRRLHSSSGAATSKSRALALAKACLNSTYGTAIFMAAVGDHPWRKLHGESDDHDATKIRSWREGPFIDVPDLLRVTGRTGARGRAPAARDDTKTRELVLARREQLRIEHAAAIREVLSTSVGGCMSERAARVALASLLTAVRAGRVGSRRTGVRDGLGCTVFHTGTGVGTLTAPTWRVSTPQRLMVFHLPGVVVESPPEVQVGIVRELPRVLVECIL